MATTNSRFITFNYDRSLEHYRLNSLHYSHGKEFDECAKTLAKIPVIHAYGQLGKPNYSYPQERYLQYRPDPDRLINVGAARGITLLHEEAEAAASLARELLSRAKRVCFLGFSYHPLNIARLNIGGSFDLSTTIIGTARGLIGREVQIASNRLAEALGGSINLSDADNLDILRRHMFLG